MKKILYSIALLCSTSSLFAQDFALLYEPENHDTYMIIRDVSKTVSGDLITGFDLMDGTTPYAGIMKTKPDGSIVWSKTLDIPSSIAGCSFEVAENSNGNFYLWGLSKEVSTNNMRAILSEISSDGDMLWSKEYNFGYSISAAYTVNKLQILPSGDLQMMISVYNQVIVMKTTADGDIIWGKSSTIGPPDGGGKYPGFEWLSIPGEGGICASKATNDFSLLRYDEDGELLWNNTYALGGYTHGKTIVRSPNGNLLVSGFISSTPHIMEISDEDGSILWVKTFAGLTMSIMNKGHLIVDGDELILDFTTTSLDQYIIKLDADGNVLSAMKSKNQVYDYNKIEMVDQDENYFYGSVKKGTEVKGMILRTGDIFEESCLIIPIENPLLSDFEDYHVVEFAPYQSDFTAQADMTIGLVDVHVFAKYACSVVLSTELNELNQVSIYPNPATNNLTVTVAENLVNASYTITDLSGKQVLTDIVYANQIQIDLANLSNGQYIFAIRTENELLTEKITVLK